MHTEGNEVHETTDEARAGSTPNIVRWVLAISLLAAIVLLSLVWMTGAASTDEGDREANVTDRVANATDDSADSTDSIVDDEPDAGAPEAPAAAEAPSGPEAPAPSPTPQ